MKRLPVAVCSALLLLSAARASADRHDAPPDAAPQIDDDGIALEALEGGDDRNENERRYLAKKWVEHPYQPGEPLPARYQDDRFHVEDYRRRGLVPPPDGHYWVRTDEGSYLLVANRTGVIADVSMRP